MAKKAIHHMDFDDLATINGAVVSLTQEPCEYSQADGQKLKELLVDVEDLDSESPDEAITRKAALLVFKLASGQHFRGGNKRTALVAGEVFLAKNGHKLDMKDSNLVSTVDRVGIAAASFDDLFSVMEGLVKRTKTDRRSWSTVIKDVVGSNKEFLIESSS